MPGSLYWTEAKPCRGATRLGVRCGRTTRNPSGWCGQCDGSGRDEPPSRALTVDEIGVPPDPLTLDERRAAVADRRPVRASRARRLVWWSRLTGDRAPVVALAAGDRGPLTPEARAVLAGHPSWEVRGAVLEHPDVTPEELTRALGDADWRVVMVAAAHPNMPGEHLPGLLVRGARLVREAAASNPSAPGWALHAAAKRAEPLGDWEVLRAVARNPASEPDTLDWIAGHGDLIAARDALSHPAFPPAALARVATDPVYHPDLRAAAARNPRCPAAQRAQYGLEAG